jgi:hypothetical protein
MRRRRGDLRAVDRHDSDPDQAAARTQRQHLAEQVGDRRLVADPEARDRRVIGRVIGGDTRNATSSRQRRSIARDDRTPIA